MIYAREGACVLTFAVEKKIMKWNDIFDYTFKKKLNKLPLRKYHIHLYKWI